MSVWSKIRGWYRAARARHAEACRNLDFSGNGRISVKVADILSSAKVQRQVEAVRQIEAEQK